MSNGFVASRADHRDIPEIVALINAAYAPWEDLIGRKPLPMTVDYEAALENHLIDVVRHQDTLIGMIEMCVEADSLLIESVAVSPDHQKRGLGTVLLQHAEKQAEQLELPKLRLYTNQKFRSNIDFYQRFGFKIERTEPFMDGRTVYMDKSLTEEQ